MRLDIQAEHLLAIQAERTRHFREQQAAAAEAPRRAGLVARLLGHSGALLILVGARLQGWSGFETAARPAVQHGR